MSHFFSHTYHNPLRALQSRTFIDPELNIANITNIQAQLLQHPNAIISDVFNIISTTNISININSTISIGKGVYNPLSNSIDLKFDHNQINSFKGTFTHEGTHGALNKLFANGGTPYFENDSEAEELYIKSIENVLDNFAQLCGFPNHTNTTYPYPTIGYLANTINIIYNPIFYLSKFFVGKTLNYTVSPTWQIGQNLANALYQNDTLCSNSPIKEVTTQFFNIYRMYQDYEEHKEVIVRMHQSIAEGSYNSYIRKVFMPLEEFWNKSVRPEIYNSLEKNDHSQYCTIISEFEGDGQYIPVQPPLAAQELKSFGFIAPVAVNIYLGLHLGNMLGGEIGASVGLLYSTIFTNDIFYSLMPECSRYFPTSICDACTKFNIDDPWTIPYNFAITLTISVLLEGTVVASIAPYLGIALAVAVPYNDAYKYAVSIIEEIKSYIANDLENEAQTCPANIMIGQCPAGQIDI